MEPEHGTRGGRPHLRGCGNVAHKGQDVLSALAQWVFTGAVPGLGCKGNTQPPEQ